MLNLDYFEVHFVNVHALCVNEMINYVKEGLHTYSTYDIKKLAIIDLTYIYNKAKEGIQTNSTYDTKLLAVTVLTSMDNQVINREVGLGGTVDEEVTRLAKLSEDSGASGVVCSVHEAALIKETTQPNFVTMTPGIRLLEDQPNDQKRVATPKFAKQNGSDYIVIGRSVTQAKNPKLAYESALKEWLK